MAQALTASALCAALRDGPDLTQEEPGTLRALSVALRRAQGLIEDEFLRRGAPVPFPDSSLDVLVQLGEVEVAES